MNDESKKRSQTDQAVQAIENTLDDFVTVAEGTDQPATKAYMMGQQVELPIYGIGTAEDIVTYLKSNGHAIPNEFTEYIEAEMEDASSVADAHLRAMARRGIEQVVYEEING